MKGPIWELPKKIKKGLPNIRTDGMIKKEITDMRTVGIIKKRNTWYENCQNNKKKKCPTWVLSNKTISDLLELSE